MVLFNCHARDAIEGHRSVADYRFTISRQLLVCLLVLDESAQLM